MNLYVITFCLYEIRIIRIERKTKYIANEFISIQYDWNVVGKIVTRW